MGLGLGGDSFGQSFIATTFLCQNRQMDTQHQQHIMQHIAGQFAHGNLHPACLLPKPGLCCQKMHGCGRHFGFIRGNQRLYQGWQNRIQPQPCGQHLAGVPFQCDSVKMADQARAIAQTGRKPPGQPFFHRRQRVSLSGLHQLPGKVSQHGTDAGNHALGKQGPRFFSQKMGKYGRNASPRVVGPYKRLPQQGFHRISRDRIANGINHGAPIPGWG